MKDERSKTKDQTYIRRTVNKIWLAVLAIMFFAFVLRVYRLDFASLRGDEAFTVLFVQRTWEALWKGISTIEPNPPLLYLALREWIALTGASEFPTRYFSVFFGVLCVPLLYRLAREMFASPSHLSPVSDGGGRRVGVNIALLAAGLMAINPYQVWHSQDVRNYTMWPALSLLALIFLWRWWRAERQQTTDNRRQIILNLTFFILAELASLYTHYYDTFILAAVNVFVFAFDLLERRWKTLARWIGAQVVLMLVYAPWVLFGTNRVTTYGEASAEKSVSLLDIFSRTLVGFVASDSVPDIFGTVVWLPLLVALVAILVYLVRKNREGAAFLFLCIAVPTLAVYVISIGRPLFLERYLNGIAPAYYLTFAVGLGALWWGDSSGGYAQPSLPTPTQFQPTKVGFAMLLQRLQPPALAFAILFFAATSAYALANYYFDPAYAKAPNWRALMQFVVARQQPGDIVVQNFTDDAISYYRNLLMHQGAPAEQQPGCDNSLGYLPVITLPKDFWHTAADEKKIRQLNTDCRRIWFIPSTNDVWDPDQFIGRFLSRTDDSVINTLISGYRLQLYLTPREFEPKIIPVNARIGNATLVGYRAEGTRALHVVLYWRAARQIEKDYTMFVHLAGAGDYVIAQKDNAPVGGTYPTSAWQPGELIVDAYDLQVDAAPGTYALLVGMYDPATLVRVPVFDTNGTRLPNDRVMLTQVTIQ